MTLLFFNRKILQRENSTFSNIFHLFLKLHFKAKFSIFKNFDFSAKNITNFQKNDQTCEFEFSCQKLSKIFNY